MSKGSDYENCCKRINFAAIAGADGLRIHEYTLVIVDRDNTCYDDW